MALKALSIFSYIFLMILSVCCGLMGGLLISQKTRITTVFGIYNMQILGYVLIGTAVLLFITSIFGLCGTVTESRLCTILFLSIISVIFTILIISGSLLFVYNTKVQEMVSSQLTKEFVVKYGHDEDFTLVWDEIQPKFNCCGINNGADYTSTQWYNKAKSESHRDGEVPNSCCTRKPDGEYYNITMCSQSRVEDNGPYIYKDGCWDKMKVEISRILYWTSIAIFIFCGIMVLIIIFSCVNRSTRYSQVV